MDNDNTWKETDQVVQDKGYTKIGDNTYQNSGGDIIITDGKTYKEDKYRINYDSTKEDN